MKFQRNIFIITSLILLSFVLQIPVFGQTMDTVRKLSAKEFARQMDFIPNGILIDARTSHEFEKGHLKNAANYNVLAADEFDQQIATLDKTTPVFVYCHSGKRSTVAAGKLRAEGFSQIFELTGGIKEWRESNFEETMGMSTRITRNQFANMLDSAKTVLVEFFNPLCEPCKKLKKNLTSISKKKGEKVTIIRINVNENPNLVKDLFIGEIPVLHLYKNKKLNWVSEGVIKKREILKQLK